MVKTLVRASCLLLPLSIYPLHGCISLYASIRIKKQLGISGAVDYNKYYLYFLITHSTAIEGSMLTELDTQLLFDEGVTAKGKPLVYHLMNEDLKNTYELCTIHPWGDGNGRTSRLLMNYVQFLYNLFPTKIFKEDRDEYLLSLRQSQDEDTICLS